jgi:hypothetical protein
MLIVIIFSKFIYSYTFRFTYSLVNYFIHKIITNETRCFYLYTSNASFYWNVLTIPVIKMGRIRVFEIVVRRSWAED